MKLWRMFKSQTDSASSSPEAASTAVDDTAQAGVASEPGPPAEPNGDPETSTNAASSDETHPAATNARQQVTHTLMGFPLASKVVAPEDTTLAPTTSSNTTSTHTHAIEGTQTHVNTTTATDGTEADRMEQFSNDEPFHSSYQAESVMLPAQSQATPTEPQTNRPPASHNRQAAQGLWHRRFKAKPTTQPETEPDTSQPATTASNADHEAVLDMLSQPPARPSLFVGNDAPTTVPDQQAYSHKTTAPQQAEKSESASAGASPVRPSSRNRSTANESSRQAFRSVLQAADSRSNQQPAAASPQRPPHTAAMPYNDLHYESLYAHIETLGGSVLQSEAHFVNHSINHLVETYFRQNPS